jgi:hypothetical protein
MNYNTTSRRDDLIGLFYFLAYLKSDNFPFDFVAGKTKEENFKIISKQK